MSEYYIDLGGNEYINLSSRQVDLLNYDNNRGYDVYAIAICGENGEVVEEYDFATREARDMYIEDQGLDYQNGEWLYDVESFDITIDNGSRQELISCLCDVNVAYCS